MKLSKVLKNTSVFFTLHEVSKLTPDMLKNPGKNHPNIWLKNFYKEYPRCPQIFLPVNKKVKKKDLFGTILQRKSAPKLKKRNIDLATISEMLFFSAGINRIGSKNIPAKRMYPSGAARYPLEIYLIQKQDLLDFKTGIYHYNVKSHALELLKKSGFIEELKSIGGEINKDFLQNASMLLVITAVFGRTEIKYGKSTYKLILLEAGHLGQNICLVSSALGIASRPLGGFVDQKMNILLQLNEEREQALYIIALGRS